MKKIAAMFAFVSFALAVHAAGGMDYVTVEGKNYFSEDVKIGPNNVRLTTEDGLILKAPLKKVDAFMVDGKLYERLPLICCKGKSKGTALMEFISQRNDLRLYRFHVCNEGDKLGCRFYDESNDETVLFVFREGQLYLRVDKNNAETVLPFFHVTYKNKM